MHATSVDDELDRLVRTLHDLGYPALAGISGPDFDVLIEPLRLAAHRTGAEAGPDSDAPVYLLLDVDTGAETLGVRPDDALSRIRAAGTTPLTIDEGVALVTQHPSVFTDRNAFQALASRAPNKRVPSFWVSKGAPRLGWCWAGNPHSWLGAASAAGRQGRQGSG